ncbi:hypothetical protein PVAP13_9NG218773 [Panicum virgatum]|uniref:Uncharacterized protein n=1 Tax=Panicum virgatum TaxID=38727 RepID=A0A8T0MID4_PANVG|nr:hypothetical protein PVAP13_9NG218773 [Panicum virgatum]
MNICLLSKWIFKLERGESNVCLNLLRNKYLGVKGLHAIKDSCIRGLKYEIHNGKKVRFWLDVWFEECPLKIRFPNLFKICNQKDCSVAECIEGEYLMLTFNRSLGW